MKIHALIPARGGSKGVPKKNITLLGDHPLLAYSIAQAKLSDLVDDVIVTTDCSDIAQVAKDYGASVPFLRPAEISQDHSLDIEFFKHYITVLQENQSSLPDLILFLRPTTPLRETSTINDALQWMIDHLQATGLRSMHPSRLTPYKMFKSDDGFAKPFVDFDGEKEFYNYPRQRFEDTFIPNGYVDVVRTTTLLETDMLFGEKLWIFKTDHTPDIDTLDDFQKAQKLLQSEKFIHLTDYLNQVKVCL